MRSEKQSRATSVQYQTLRSVTDLHLFVVCKDGEFYESVLANLNTQYLLEVPFSWLVCSLGSGSLRRGV